MRKVRLLSWPSQHKPLGGGTLEQRPDWRWGGNPLEVWGIAFTQKETQSPCDRKSSGGGHGAGRRSEGKREGKSSSSPQAWGHEKSQQEPKCC